MSDEQSTTQPDAGAEQTNVANQATNAQPNQAEQPQQQAADAGQQAQPAGDQPEPYAVFPDAELFHKRMSREAKKLMNAQARELGFDDWDAMQAVFNGRRQASGEQPDAGSQPQGTDDGERLRMALQVGQELNLPAALISRLQGDTVEAMKADAEQLQKLMQPQAPAGPGIRPAPETQQQATFTRAQLSNPAFVRENKDAIMRAAREGRIVES